MFQDLHHQLRACFGVFCVIPTARRDATLTSGRKWKTCKLYTLMLDNYIRSSSAYRMRQKVCRLHISGFALTLKVSLSLAYLVIFFQCIAVMLVNGLAPGSLTCHGSFCIRRCLCRAAAAAACCCHVFFLCLLANAGSHILGKGKGVLSLRLLVMMPNRILRT
jgi:hypothetical protein